MAMRLLYYDLLRGSLSGTAGSHIREVTKNIALQGHEVFFYSEDSKQEESICLNADRPSIWGKIGKRWPVINIYLALPAEIGVFCRGLAALMRTGRPDVIYYRHRWFFNAGYWTAKLLKLPSIKEVNGLVVPEIKMHGPSSRMALDIIDGIERRDMPKADRIVAVTKKLKDLLIEDYRVPREKIVVLENGANVDLFRPLNKQEAQKALGLDANLTYVCFSGLFAAWQGLEYLIRSVPLVLHDLPDTRFLLVGDGNLRSGLEQMAKDLGIKEKVIFTGLAPYAQVPLYINASDICLLPKVPLITGYSPLKLCEYLACRRPVVASRISGLEVLEDYNMGILVNPEDEVALAQGIVALLHNPELREIMGSNGREYVVEHRSWKMVARKTIQLCEELIEESSRR